MKAVGFVESLVVVACACWTLQAPAQSQAAVPGPTLPLVENGQPRAQIVVGEQRPRMTTLAALELRHYIQKISGARLPIVTAPTAAQAVKLFVGQSDHTDALGVTAADLRDGAFRLVSGSDWIVLLGHDFDFDADRSPVGLSRNDNARALAEWQAAVKAHGKTETGWGFPFGGTFKHLWSPNNFAEILTRHYGEDAESLWTNGGNRVRGFWNQDEGGSLNAVYALLRDLGARWFMPGELGEVLPTPAATVTAGPFDRTVTPDYPVRAWSWYNYAAFSFDDVVWARRIGMNAGYEKLGICHGVHGLVPVHSTAAMQAAHPEYYALIAGKRDVEHRGHGTPCFTSAGLERETVNYLRFLFDTYGLPHAGIWPVDGLKACGCDECRGKTPSELVWEFADRVAREVYKTHPDRLITCGAYTTYIDAPDTVAAFSPNLAVWIANSARPRMMDPEHWANYWARVETWRGKMAPGRILRLENNRYHIWGVADGVRGLPISYPVIHPRAAARDLKALKGVSAGDIGEQSQFRAQWKAMGIEHITLYVQSRFLWDADLDVDEVLDEYCAMFYGPAAAQMKAAIDFAERNIAHKDQSRGRGRGNPMNVPLATAIKLRDLLDEALATAGEGVYAQRVQAVIDTLQPREETIAQYREREAALAEARANAPVAVGVQGSDLSGAAVYRLKNIRGGRDAAEPETTFRVGWDENALVLDIVCREPEMKQLVVAEDVGSGDYVAVSLATPNHSYYHIEISPDGAMLEGNPTRGWKSLAEVQTERGIDFWRIVVRIPAVGDDEAEADPNHRVAGSLPTAEAPWYFNVGRHRVADLEVRALQAFSPTGRGWHVPERFGRLEID